MFQKKQSKLRLVLDCRHVNNSIKCPSFSQQGIQSVAKQIQEDDDLISIDLKSGFHHVKIQVQYHKYLGFYWNGDFFVWQVLLFGVKCVPYYFNKILRPVVEFFRVQNIRNSLFVDDFLIMMRKMFTTDHSEFVLQTLQELGWEINWEKSKLIPSNYCEFIGFNIFSKGNDGPWIQVTQKKLHKLKRHISVALKCEWINARFLEK